MTSYHANETHQIRHIPLVGVIAILILGMLINAAFAVGMALVVQSNYQNSINAQKTAGAKVEASLCTTFNHLAALQPPPGSPSTNPSRAYDQGLHEILDQLPSDLGLKCNG